MSRVISLELNELNFDFIEQYIAKGELPNFRAAIERHGLVETVAEDRYPFLEPWIQWPTVYSGKTYAEHGVFRLGDIVDKDYPQIWEVLAQRGVSVGALSPMNAANRVPEADFFVPDPWTVTPVSGGKQLEELAGIVKAAVNGNAHGGEGMVSLGRKLMPFVWQFASPSSWREYARILRYSAKYKWARASFLDRFLADVFLKLRAKHGTRFSSVFLNSGAHIQHHHMYEAGVYNGDQSNPSWYSTAKDDGVDPILFAYRVYDGILGDFMRQPDTRLLVTTGLSQVANPRTIYQYRFIDHGASLARLGIADFTIVPRMSRDFLVEFKDPAALSVARDAMAAITCGGKPFFTIEDREQSLFCQICYFGPPEGLTEVSTPAGLMNMRDEIVLVSIENGIHQTIGYHIDTAMQRVEGDAPVRVPLTTIFDKMCDAFANEKAATDTLVAA